MLVGYIDEAGCTGPLPNNISSIQPLFIVLCITILENLRNSRGFFNPRGLGGWNPPIEQILRHCLKDYPGCGSPRFVVLPAEGLNRLTLEYLAWKEKYFPGNLQRRKLDHLLIETKGCILRKMVRDSGNKRKFALTVLNDLVGILERNGAKLIGRVWVKGIGLPFQGRSVYTYSIQDICKGVNRLCDSEESFLIIADSRNKTLNEQVAHSIFTQMYKIGGSSYPHLVETPVFGHSGNHAGIQMADLLCSALLFPMAAISFCSEHVLNPMHVDDSYLHLKRHFGQRLKRLQYRYRDADLGKWMGGITVSDSMGNRNGQFLFS